jgi:ribonuclease BN (tRNA processing enzyme)
MSEPTDQRMKLTIVGCSGSFSGPHGATSCYLVEAPYEGRTYRLVLDIGSGSLGPLQRYCKLDAIDAVAISHLHPDHCHDLCGFYVVRKYHPGGALPPIPVYGPEGTADRMARAYGCGDPVGMTAEFDFFSYSDEPIDVGPFTLSVAEVVHPITSYAIKVSYHGRSFVYTGDTGPCSVIETFGRGCDLMLSEASFVETVVNPENLHMTGKEAAELTAAAGVPRLVLTHIPPWYSPDVVYAEARPHFDGELLLAEPGAVYEI